MRANAPRRRARQAGSRPKRRWIAGVAGVAAAALVVTLAVVASGFDSRETPREDPSVWVVRSAGQYARVNTETAEIDTVRQVEGPSGVVQSGAFGLLLTQGDGRAWAIDAAAPQDVRERATADGTAGADAAGTDEQDPQAAENPDSEAEGDAARAETSGSTASESEQAAGSAIRTPGGTREVIAAGTAVLFHTESGEAHLAPIETVAGVQRLGALVRLDPFAEQNAVAESEEDRVDYVADAVAVDANGLVALFSQSEHAIRWYDSVTGRFRSGTSEVPEEVPGEGAQLAILGGDWVLFDAESGRLWREGAPAVDVETAGTALLQGSHTGGTTGTVFVADDLGLWQLGERAERIADAEGVAARPEQVGTEMVAAWVGAASAALWSESGGEVSLELDESVADSADPAPSIRTSGGRALVSDMSTGMLWTVPDGRLIPVEQWSLVDPPKQETGTVVTQDVTEQEPPVAVDDAFGVRAGEPAPLPVLLNDYDPNRADVLTVVTEGLGEGLPAEFGTVEALSDGQGLMVHPSGAASGAASFSYRITDGVHVSPPATVTLTVVPDSVNTAPQWCPVEGCQRNWPAPEIVPGGTLVLPVLEGWVDPEGDPMMVASATPVNSLDPVRALVTADGRVAVRHTDPNATDADIAVTVRVVDARGEAAERELRVRVRPGAAAQFAPVATTVQTGEPTVLRPLERVTGGSGSFALVDAAVQSGSVGVTANTSAGTVELLAASAGSSLVSVTVRDTVTDLELSGVVRVTAVDARVALAVPPLRAFVRPLSDTTIDVLDAIPSANSRSLVVQSADVVDGELRADVIEHARIRVSGSTADGQPGRIGSADVVISEGDLVATGRLTVFQVPETAASGAIAVADAVTVRAGSVVNIPVLDNDVAPPGERLVLHPEVGAPGVDGELAFASGSQVRYLAPSTPGTYTLSYTTYGASSPEMSDTGQVRVTVLPTGTNRDPQPQNVTVRLAPGESVTASIPVTRADPDGDRVRLVAVGTPDDSQLSTSVLPRSGNVQVTASSAATRGTRYVGYTVRDDFGGEAEGRLRIIVADPDPAGGAPVVYSDYVRISRGAAEPVVVRPLDNDLDPSGGALTITQVVPNVPGGEDSPLYADLMARLDLSDLEQGVVRVTGGEDLGTFSFKYTVSSSKSKSTADGLIVVQVSERIGRQAPAVQDTVLSVRDRAELQTSGVDVVTGRVRWATGDADRLQLSLWGEAAGRYRVSGSSIIGSYRAEGDVVPFKLTGTDFSGAEVETFGFLVVPPLDELRLTLKPGAGALAVDENETVDGDLAQMLDLGSGDAIVLADGPFAVQRSQAQCTVVGGTTIRYSAGKEAPWADTCTVRVRLAEQTTFTVLPIQIDIRPDAPVVMLNPLTRTIAPGEGETIDLSDMVTWQGGREGQIDQLRWQVGSGASPFEVVSSGAQVQVQVSADGVPGAQQVIAVGVSGSGEAQAMLTLRVGTAAQDAPRGATVSLQCTVDQTCTVPLVGVGGEYDPFAGKSGGGLHLVAVDAAGCQFGNLQASGDSVTVSWPTPRGPGGQCTASFTVRDAQNRTGTGQIAFDAQGVPRPPQTVNLVQADEGSVTLEVPLGDAASAYPAVTGVVIVDSERGEVGSCAPSGASYRCVVGGLDVGVPRIYVARAVNAVGQSDPTGPLTTWAFRQPRVSGQLHATQTSAESTNSATVKIDVDDSGADRTVGRYEVSIAGASGGMVSGTITGWSGSVTISGVQVGADIPYSVTPISQFAPPPSGGGGSTGDSVPGQLNVAGLPLIENLQIEAPQGSTNVEVTFSVNGNGADELRWNAVGGSATCLPSREGIPTHTVPAPRLYESYTITVCAENRFGDAAPITQEVWIGGDPPALTLGSYTVAQGSSPWGAGVMYGLAGPLSVTGKVGEPSITYSPGGASLQLDPSVIPSVTAVQCLGSRCSVASNVAGWVNAPTSVTVVPSGVSYVADTPPVGLAALKTLLTISGPAQGWVADIVPGTPTGTQIPLDITWAGTHNGQNIALNQATVWVDYVPPTGP